MLTATYRKHGIRLSHVWFAKPHEIESGEYLKGAGDLVFLHAAASEPKRGVLYTTQHSLVKDLTPSTDELFMSFGRHLRQYIKRSAKDESISLRIIDSKTLLCELDTLDAVADLYSDMFSAKGMQSSFNKSLALKYAEADALCIGVAYEEEVPVGFSAIITDGEWARLWTSAFDFRNPNRDRQTLSRAHQRLDWEMLCWCKSRGVSAFDFGGVNSFDEPNGIAQFKLGFERENKVTYHNYLIPSTLIGRIALNYFLRSR